MLRTTMKVLIVVATYAEAQALQMSQKNQALSCKIVVSGVGPVAAALATQAALTQQSYDLVVSAGIAGAFSEHGLYPGDVVLSSQIIQADLGAWDKNDFCSLKELGLSLSPTQEHSGVFEVWPKAYIWAEQISANYGPMLTLSSVTGSDVQAKQLQERYPNALTEGMEGAGVAHASWLAGVPVVEIRGISNMVGPRDRSAWQIAPALVACAQGLVGLEKLVI